MSVAAAAAAVASASAEVPAAAAAAFARPKAEFNQYWHSAATTSAINTEVLQLPGPAVFLSTPSLFCALPAAARAARGDALLDIDAASFSGLAGFHAWDYAAGVAGLPPTLLGRCALAVIDPPFITAEVWQAYAAAAAALLAPGGAIIATTTRENEALLARLLGADLVRTPFLPSIPHLVYQYSLFTRGFTPTVLGRANPEIPGDE